MRSIAPRSPDDSSVQTGCPLVRASQAESLGVRQLQRQRAFHQQCDGPPPESSCASNATLDIFISMY